MSDIFIILIIFFGIVSQIILGTAGIYLPVLALLIFYIALNFKFLHTLFYAMLCGIMIDAVAGRDVPWHIIIFAVLTVVGNKWASIKQFRTWYFNFIPGLMAAAIQVVPLALINFQFDDSVYFIINEWLPVFAASMFFAALFMPLAALVLNDLGVKLKLPPYRPDLGIMTRNTRRWY
ncbi:MAG: hypothetical protein PHR12_03060 [Victivallaceae bacterium]|nr:hypothetical protein [Victivallaceae bacterium]